MTSEIAAVRQGGPSFATIEELGHQAGAAASREHSPPSMRLEGIWGDKGIQVRELLSWK